jgi:hypothetical protein
LETTIQQGDLRQTKPTHKGFNHFLSLLHAALCYLIASHCLEQTLLDLWASTL